MRLACISSPVGTLFGTLLFSVALVGCASEGDALDKRLAKLQEELRRVQSQTDRMAERLDAMELQTATAPKPEERAASTETATVSRPKLKVVRVESEDAPAEVAENDARADDGAPRLMISGEGKALETRSVPGTAKSAPKTETKPETKKSEASKAAK